MRRIRTLVVLLAAMLVAGALAIDTAPSAHADTSPPSGAMSTWGYWIGPSAAGFKFVRQKLASKYNTNTALIQVAPDTDLPTLKNVLDKAKAQRVGVALMFDQLLRKPNPPGNGCGFFCDPDFVYTADDYAQWNARLQAVKDGIGSSVDAVTMVVGFDESNVYWSVGFQAAAGQPKPLPYAMQLFAQYFPTVSARGHVWKIGPDGDTIDTPPTADTLEGQTLPLAYFYSDFIGPFNKTTVPYCPHEGTMPAALPPDGSFLAKDRDVLKLFIDRVNTLRGNTTTPVMFVPYSNANIGAKPTVGRGLACHLESSWYWMQCKAMRNPNSWAGQIKGFLPWTWAKLLPSPDSQYSWSGTEGNAMLKKAGKWIGSHRGAPPCPASM